MIFDIQKWCQGLLECVFYCLNLWRDEYGQGEAGVLPCFANNRLIHIYTAVLKRGKSS